MNFKFILYLAFIIPLLFLPSTRNLYSAYHTEPDQGSVEYRLVVKIIGDEWRVVLEDDESKSDITVRRGDRIRWIVEESDASFAFPDERIFDRGTSQAEKNKPLMLVITPRSPKGTFPYTVFIHESMTYARGQSPPRIIIK